MRGAGVIRLIRAYLNAGSMNHGVVLRRDEATSQDGSLSPLRANVLLDEVDRELERRGHRFERDADDCKVYLRSRKAGDRVMSLLTRLDDKMHLKINESKGRWPVHLAADFSATHCGWPGKARSNARSRIRRLKRSSS